jgi:hypothetical protein
MIQDNFLSGITKLNTSQVVIKPITSYAPTPVVSVPAVNN